MASILSDKDLIAGCLENNRRHQEALYRKFFPKMISMCYRYTTDRDKAMIIVNDGFLKVFKKLDTFQNKGSFEGWIRRIVFNSLSDYFKKENRYLKFLILEERDQAQVSNSSDNLYYEDLLTLVEQLPFATSEVFKLYAIEGYTHKEIGKKLNISDGTSKWHLSEARKKLKVLINRNLSMNHAG